jgi:hypothetical protein
VRPCTGRPRKRLRLGTVNCVRIECTSPAHSASLFSILPRRAPRKKKAANLPCPRMAASGPHILSLFLGRNEASLGGGGIKIGRYSGELLEKFFLINPLNFDLRTSLRELLEMLLAPCSVEVGCRENYEKMVSTGISPLF